MPDDQLSPARFGTAFKAFMEAVARAATPVEGALFERIRAHLGVDVAQLPVVAEEFDPYEHPNVQVAIDAYFASETREADLVGVAAQQRHYVHFGLSTITGQGAMPGMPPVIEGPVDYVNFHLAGDRVLPCVQFGLYVVIEGETRYVVAVIGPSEQYGRVPCCGSRSCRELRRTGGRFSRSCARRCTGSMSIVGMSSPFLPGHSGWARRHWWRSIHCRTLRGRM
jgi:hypothetical protein